MLLFETNPRLLYYLRGAFILSTGLIRFETRNGYGESSFKLRLKLYGAILLSLYIIKLFLVAAT